MNRERELLFTINKSDFIIQTFRCGGNGGQNQNKVNSGVRIIHKASGVTTESREERSQLQNKHIAFKRLTNDPQFKLWIQRRVNEIETGKTLEQKVSEDMRDENLKIEAIDADSGGWTEIK